MNRAEQWVREIAAEAEKGSTLGDLAENFAYLLDHTDEWEDGAVHPEDLPNFDEGLQTLIVYSVMLGTLWELAHPSIYAVMDGQQLIALYGSETEAEERADELGPSVHVQRMSVADGDEPPEAILEMPEVA